MDNDWRLAESSLVKETLDALAAYLPLCRKGRYNPQKAVMCVYALAMWKALKSDGACHSRRLLRSASDHRVLYSSPNLWSSWDFCS
jgi:hypothetical protein